MKNIYKLCLAFALIFSIPTLSSAQKTTKYKCMVQMTNYTGEGAYIAVSLIDAKGAYEKTLYVMGSDKKWYPDLKEWHKAYKSKPTNISAVTGASVTGGDRSVTVSISKRQKLTKDINYALKQLLKTINIMLKMLRFL